MARIYLIVEDQDGLVIESTNLDHTRGVDPLGQEWEETEDGTWYCPESGLWARLPHSDA